MKIDWKTIKTATNSKPVVEKELGSPALVVSENQEDIVARVMCPKFTVYMFKPKNGFDLSENKVFLEKAIMKQPEYDASKPLTGFVFEGDGKLGLAIVNGERRIAE